MTDPSSHVSPIVSWALALAVHGATWSCHSPDYGPETSRSLQESVNFVKNKEQRLMLAESTLNYLSQSPNLCVSAASHFDVLAWQMNTHASEWERLSAAQCSIESYNKTLQYMQEWIMSCMVASVKEGADPLDTSSILLLRTCEGGVSHLPARKHVSCSSWKCCAWLGWQCGGQMRGVNRSESCCTYSIPL